MGERLAPRVVHRGSSQVREARPAGAGLLADQGKRSTIAEEGEGARLAEFEGTPNHAPYIGYGPRTPLGTIDRDEDASDSGRYWCYRLRCGRNLNASLTFGGRRVYGGGPPAGDRARSGRGEGAVRPSLSR